MEKPKEKLEKLAEKDVNEFYQDETPEPETDISHENYDLAIKIKQEGREFFFKKNFTAALNKFEEAQSYMPESQIEERVKLFSNSAICMMKLGRYQEAVGFCSEALELDPKFAKARYNRAESYYQLERFENAVEDLKQAFVDRPDLTDPDKLRV